MLNKLHLNCVIIFNLCFFLFFSYILFAQVEDTVESILVKYQKAFYYAGKDMKAEVKMSLINREGKVRNRELVMLRKNMPKNDEQKYFMYFNSPADVRRMTFMVWKYPNRDDGRWLFIPAINLVNRIAANDKRSSFVGSDFTYEDISGRDLQSDTHIIIGEEAINERNCYKIESVSVEEAEFSKKIIWIDKSNFLPIKEEYYNIQNELYKRFTADELKEVNGMWTVMKRTMENVKRGHKTIVEYIDVKYNVGIPDNLFTERFLRNPPRRWIQ